jgi:hypothetical protein
MLIAGEGQGEMVGRERLRHHTRALIATHLHIELTAAATYHGSRSCPTETTWVRSWLSCQQLGDVVSAFTGK